MQLTPEQLHIAGGRIERAGLQGYDSAALAFALGMLLAGYHIRAFTRRGVPVHHHHEAARIAEAMAIRTETDYRRDNGSTIHAPGARYQIEALDLMRHINDSEEAA